jgi:hypothetical protein
MEGVDTGGRRKPKKKRGGVCVSRGGGEGWFQFLIRFVGYESRWSTLCQARRGVNPVKPLVTMFLF